MTAPLHIKDADCAPHLDADEQCRVCGVSHTAECPECGGRGFHKEDCADNDERIDDGNEAPTFWDAPRGG